MGAAATKQTKEVTSRAIDVLDPRQVEVELAITAHRIGREPGLLNFGDPRPGEIALELQADSVELWLYGDPQHDLSRAPKTANAMPESRRSRSIRKASPQQNEPLDITGRRPVYAKVSAPIGCHCQHTGTEVLRCAGSG